MANREISKRAVTLYVGAVLMMLPACYLVLMGNQYSRPSERAAGLGFLAISMALVTSATKAARSYRAKLLMERLEKNNPV